MGVRQPKVWFFIILENLLKLYCTNEYIEALSYSNTVISHLHLGVPQYSGQALGWKIWGSNSGRGKGFLYSANCPG